MQLSDLNWPAIQALSKDTPVVSPSRRWATRPSPAALTGSLLLAKLSGALPSVSPSAF
jgi:hypothetical protein